MPNDIRIYLLIIYLIQSGQPEHPQWHAARCWHGLRMPTCPAAWTHPHWATAMHWQLPQPSRRRCSHPQRWSLWSWSLTSACPACLPQRPECWPPHSSWTACAARWNCQSYLQDCSDAVNRCKPDWSWSQATACLAGLSEMPGCLPPTPIEQHLLLAGTAIATCRIINAVINACCQLFQADLVIESVSCFCGRPASRAKMLRTPC